jgi:ubiquinone/menaquinone biosynthesis C-methylase UbiE
MIQERIRREFNRWADSGHDPGLEKRHWETTRQLIDLMNIDAYHNVMDLGCGVGSATRVLAQKAARGLVLGIDLSDRMVLKARRSYRNPQNAMFLVADASGIPCADGLFDSLMSVESLYYYPGLDLAFHEVHRVLKPGGKAFFLVSYYKENPHGHEWAKHIDIPTHLLGAEDYTAILKRTGFKTASHRRLIDSTPLPDDWQPAHWFPTRRDHTNFRSEGSLLLIAEKM